MSLSRAQTLTFTDSSIGCFMLMQIVGGCLCAAVCVSIHRLCEFIMLMHVTFLPPCTITSTAHILCVTVEIQWPELYPLLRREW